MVEKVKKTTSSETSKLKKVPVRKPRTTEKQSIKEEKSTISSKPATPTETKKIENCKIECTCKEINFRLIMLLVLVLMLFLNLIVGIRGIIKISNLQHWTTIETGGEENRERLEAIYTTSEYQEYFRGQIDSLEQQIKIMNPKTQ